METGPRKLSGDAEIDRAYTAYILALAEWRRKPGGDPRQAPARVIPFPNAQPVPVAAEVINTLLNRRK